MGIAAGALIARTKEGKQMTKDEDSILLAERLGQEQEANKELKLKVKQLEWKIKDIKWKWRRREVFEAVLGIVIGIAVVIGGSYLGWKGIHRQTTNHCYIEKGSELIDVYKVLRTVDWGSDLELGHSVNLDEAKEIATKQECKL